MDPISAVPIILSVYWAFDRAIDVLVHPITHFNVIVSILREARTGNVECWTRIHSPTHIGYIRIWDHSGIAHSQIATNSPFLFRTEMAIKKDTPFGSFVDTIPWQESGSARVFILEALDPDVDAQAKRRRSGRINRQREVSLERRFFRRFSPPSSHTMGFTSLLHRRTPRVPSWYRLSSFELYPLATEREEYMADISYVRVERSLCFTEQGDQSQALINCKTSFLEKRHQLDVDASTQDGFHPFSATASFAKVVFELGATYSPFKTTPHWQEVFSLQYLHANLLLHAQFVVAYEEAYVERIQTLFDPRRSDFKQGHLKEITRHSCHVQEAGRAGDHMIDIVEHLIDVARETANATSKQPAGANFAELELEITGLCREIRGSIKRLSASLEHDLKFLSLRREMEQTSSVQQLTILATIFLPLSLSAGVLSMQTRFKDLGTLLYDFFGVVVLLGALVVPFLLLLSLFKLATDHILVDLDLQITARQIEMPSRWYLYVRKYLPLVLWLGLALLATLTLVSFIIGMFLDVDLGAKILGYGVAVFSFPGLSLILFFWLVLLLRWLLKPRRRKRASRQGIRPRPGEQDEEVAHKASPPTYATAGIQVADITATDQQIANALDSRSQSSQTSSRDGP